jgi:hypothetical protein
MTVTEYLLLYALRLSHIMGAYTDDKVFFIDLSGAVSGAVYS